jgi:aryl-alcohol dehydrogenase-like predicted oxidoreductase
MTTPDLAGKVALGAASLSFLEMTESTASDVVREAYDAGIRIFDSARAYAPIGDPEHNERLLRRALEGRPDALIATKGGHWHATATTFPADNRPERLRQDAETSLRALGLERLPLYYVHRLDMDVVPADDAIGTLEELRTEGKIDRIGISNITAEQLLAATRSGSIDAVQNRISVRADPDADPLIAACTRLGIPLFGFSGFASHPHDPDKRPLDEVLPNLARVALERGLPLHRVAARALMSRVPVLSMIVGATRRETAREAGAIATQEWDAELDAAYERDRAQLTPGDYSQRVPD